MIAWLPQHYYYRTQPCEEAANAQQKGTLEANVHSGGKARSDEGRFTRKIEATLGWTGEEVLRARRAKVPCVLEDESALNVRHDQITPEKITHV